MKVLVLRFPRCMRLGCPAAGTTDAGCAWRAEGRQGGGPEWLTGEEAEAVETMSAAERMRREFEAERMRLQEQRRKGGHTAQRAASVLLFRLCQACWPPMAGGS
jgi:hypothetical protein